MVMGDDEGFDLFMAHCVQLRSVTLLILDHVLKGLEGDKSRMDEIELLMHLVCDQLEANHFGIGIY
jgi:hypothetical protein